MRRLAILLCSTLLILSFPISGCAAPKPVPPAAAGRESTPTSDRHLAKVIGSLDGQTLEVEYAGHVRTVRYLGVELPDESGVPADLLTYLAQSAAAFNRRLCEGRVVELERDGPDLDGQGRLLRYVWVGPTLVNGELVKHGLARVSPGAASLKHAGLLRAGEIEAQQASRGLWEHLTALPVAATSVTPTATGTPSGPARPASQPALANRPDEGTGTLSTPPRPASGGATSGSGASPYTPGAPAPQVPGQSTSPPQSAPAPNGGAAPAPVATPTPVRLQPNAPSVPSGGAGPQPNVPGTTGPVPGSPAASPPQQPPAAQPPAPAAPAPAAGGGGGSALATATPISAGSAPAPAPPAPAQPAPAPPAPAQPAPAPPAPGGQPSVPPQPGIPGTVPLPMPGPR